MSRWIDSALITSIKERDVKKLENVYNSLIREGVVLQHRWQPIDASVVTALHLANKSTPSVLSFLLKQIPDAPSPVDHRGWTPLHLASKNNKPQHVCLLLAAGANPAALDQLGGLTPLHLAARNNAVAVLNEVLIFIKTLPSSTHDSNRNMMIGDKNGSTPLHWACIKGHAGAVEILLLIIKKLSCDVLNVEN